MFQIYADEIKAYREGNGGNVIYLNDDKMFDVMIKLLNSKDKIAKLAVTDEEPDTKKGATKIRNLQEWTLNKDKV